MSELSSPLSLCLRLNSALFTGECGTNPVDQWQIRQALKERFPTKAWVDVFSKADLLQQVFYEAEPQSHSKELTDVSTMTNDDHSQS